MANSDFYIKFFFCLTFSFISTITFSQIKFQVDQNGIKLNQEFLEIPTDSSILHQKFGKSKREISNEFGVFYWHNQGFYTTFLTASQKITGFGFTFSKKQPKSNGKKRSKIILIKSKKLFIGQLFLLEERIDNKSTKEQLLKLGFTKTSFIDIEIDNYTKRLPYCTVSGHFRESELLSIFFEFY